LVEHTLSELWELDDRESGIAPRTTNLTMRFRNSFVVRKRHLISGTSAASEVWLVKKERKKERKMQAHHS
jgi:hypothetical protein